MIISSAIECRPLVRVFVFIFYENYPGMDTPISASGFCEGLDVKTRCVFAIRSVTISFVKSVGDGCFTVKV